MIQIPDAAVQAAEEAVYQRHERGFLIKPLVGAINMRDALTAALPHLALSPAEPLTEMKILEYIFGKYDGWDEVISKGYTPPLPLPIHLYHQGFRDKPPFQSDDLLGDKKFDTIDKAKAAAQADFERRVRECLVDKPVDVAAVRRQAFEEAKKAVCSGCNDGETVNQEGFHQKGFHTFPCHATAISALSAEPAQGEQWRVMEDAPRTGEEIIYLTKYGEIGFCKYTLAMSDDEDDLWWDFQSDADVYPQYWLPRASLPAAPTMKGQQHDK